MSDDVTPAKTVNGTAEMDANEEQTDPWFTVVAESDTID
jgi:hypothetical protein